MWRIAKDAHKAVLGCNVEVNDSRDDESNHADVVGDHFYLLASELRHLISAPCTKFYALLSQNRQFELLLRGDRES